jgi:hypothetical protein
MKKSRYTDTQIVNILKQNQAGESTAIFLREDGVRAFPQVPLI